MRRERATARHKVTTTQPRNTSSEQVNRVSQVRRASATVKGNRPHSIKSMATVPLNAAANVPDYLSIGENENGAPQDNGSVIAMSESSSGTEALHRTTVWQTFIHLTKGYVGVGVLSLPWAISQLGIPFGVIGCFVMAYWSSYNCWTVVRLKRFIEQTQLPETTAASSVEGSSVTSVTYPDVGEWAYGRTFHSFTTACICIQQMAVCTVFLSFIGENLLAVLEFLGFSTNHVAVISMALPAVVALSFLPNLKTLAPVMMAASIFILVGFGVIGIILHQEWDNRPQEHPHMNLPQVPLALCAILYSYEGICLILPVETAMKEPKYFEPVFWTSMTLVGFIFASFGGICVYVFGNVTSGSITAFLLQAYGDNESILWWIMVANAAVSLSILFTYPLQMFPALELVGPWLQQKLRKGDVANEKDLAGFDPLPPLFEHQATTEFEVMTGEHDYNAEAAEEDSEDEVKSTFSRMTASIFPTFTMPGDSPLMRVSLVFLTYLVAVVVPNVQSLISLAGALAGSSTALLIPPILELAYLRYLERDEDNKTSGIPRDKWMFERIKCYLLLFFGLIFCVIGTFASLRDIIRIYEGES